MPRCCGRSNHLRARELDDLLDDAVEIDERQRHLRLALAVELTHARHGAPPRRRWPAG